MLNKQSHTLALMVATLYSTTQRNRHLGLDVGHPLLAQQNATRTLALMLATLYWHNRT
jgi:hypothetical protein